MRMESGQKKKQQQQTIPVENNRITYSFKLMPFEF